MVRMFMLVVMFTQMKLAHKTHKKRILVMMNDDYTPHSEVQPNSLVLLHWKESMYLRMSTGPQQVDV